MNLSWRGLWWSGILLVAGAPPARLVAQGPDTTQARVAIESLRRRILADPRLPRELRGRSFDQLINMLGFAQALRIDDAELRVAVRAFYETLLKLDPTTCGRLTREGTTGGSSDLALGTTLFATADSALLDQWAEVLVVMLRVKVDKTVPRHVATAAEEEAAMVGLITGLPGDQQQRLMAGLESSDADERCWSIRTFFRELSLLPADRLGPLARSIILSQ
jgi:hypothetical protein